MDIYKKKSFKFSNEQYSRAARHAETLRARESSRFERLSMIRSCTDDSSFIEDETEENAEFLSVPQKEVAAGSKEIDLGDQQSLSNAKLVSTPQKGVAAGSKQIDGGRQQSSQKKKEPTVHPRLLMLQKWKEEKLIRQELEKQKKKQPFYSAGKPPPSLIKLPSTYKPPQNSKSSFNSTVSSMSRSRFLAPPSQISKPATSSKKIVPPSSSVLPPRLPYNFKAAASSYSKPPNSANKGNANLRKPAPNAAVQATKVGIPKTTSVVKKEVAPTYKKPTVQSSVSTNKASNSNSKLPNTANKGNIATSRKPVPNTAVSATKTNTVSNVSKSTYGLNKSTSSRNIQAPVIKITKANEKPVGQTANQRSILPKSGISRLPSKPVQKVPLPRQNVMPNSFKIPPSKPVEKVITKPSETSYIGRIFKNPTGAVKQDPKGKVKVTAHSSKAFDKTSEGKKTPSRNAVNKESGSKKTTNSFSEKSHKIENVPETPEKQFINVPTPLENIEACEESKSSENSLPELNHENIPEVTFNCEISVIQPSQCNPPSQRISTSFAPHDFKFQPQGFCSIFEDDPFEALEEARLKYMSRTSTPSKEVPRVSCSTFRPQKYSVGKQSMAIKDNKDVAKQSCETNGNEPDKNVKNVVKQAETSLNEDMLDLESPGILISDDSVEEVNDEPHKAQEIIVGLESSEKKICDENSASKILENVGLRCEGVPNENLENLKSACVCEAETGEKDAPNKYFVNDNPVNIPEATSKNEIANKSAVLDPNSNEDDNDIPGVCNALVSVESSDHQDVLEAHLNKESESCEPSKENLISEKREDPLDICGDAFDVNEVLKYIEMQKEQMKLEDEEESDKDPVFQNANERKSTGAIPKRVSILKGVSILNSIAETSDSNVSITQSPVKSSKKPASSASFTPRRSTRLSRSVFPQTPEPLNNRKNQSLIHEDDVLISLSNTPRRSMRLKKAVPTIVEDTFSPLKSTASSSNVTPRRSMRLINLNTPEKASGSDIGRTNLTANFQKLRLSSSGADVEKTNLTTNFQKLRITSSENEDPNDLLIDFRGSPEPVLKCKTKKVSLLYSPDRRKSIRKSIRGDLMSFSPSSN